MDARKIIDKALSDYYGEDRRMVTDDGKHAGALWGAAAYEIVCALEAAGYRVVPTDLVDNARTLIDNLAEMEACDDPKDRDVYADVARLARNGLAASLAAYDGNDSLDVFQGKP